MSKNKNTVKLPGASRLSMFIKYTVCIVLAILSIAN